MSSDTFQFPKEPEVTEIPEVRVSWLQRIWNAITAPSAALEEIGERRSARLAASLLFAIFFLNTFGRVWVAVRDGFMAAMNVGAIFSVVAGFVAYLISRTRWYRISVFIFALSFSTAAYTVILEGDSTTDISGIVFIFIPLSLIVASFFLPNWMILLLAAINIGGYLYLPQLGVTPGGNYGGQSGIIFVISLVLILLNNYRNATEKIRLETIRETNLQLEALSAELEERVVTRTKELTEATEHSARQSGQLIAIAELARTFTEAQNLDILLPTITEFVSERLGYYHVGIFLNDDDDIYAVLRAANSSGGKKMLKRGHRLRIGKEGIVGYSIWSGQPRIALSVGMDAVYFDNPDLPDTLSEMAIPLRLGPEFIGALDIQSTEENAFSNADMPVFTTLADQVAIAIQNARLFTQTQSALQEVEEAYARQTGQAWETYAKMHETIGYHFDGDSANPISAGDNSNSNFEAPIELPMRLRGQKIGNIKLRAKDDNRVWSDEELALIASAIERTALALENARLFEQAERRALKERIISEGSTRVSAELDIEGILQAAAEELEQALGSSQVVIQLESEESS